MDGLALLCALHADGPQSLRKLRRSGCPSLESVASFDVERLAELLASTPNAAQRFQREAQHLLVRLGPTSSGRDTAGTLLDTEESAAPEPLAAPKPYDAALARWRELDALEDAGSVAEPIVEESSAPSHHASPRTSLSVLQDLADESRDALLAIGIVDIEGLASCDALELSQATGLDYSNAVRWRALARRALPQGAERFSRSGKPESARAPLLALDDALESYVLRPVVTKEVPRTLATRAPVDLHAEAAGGPFA